VLPAPPSAPAGLRGRHQVVIDGAVLGPAAPVLAPLRALHPEVDTFGAVAPAALARLHLEPEGPRPDGRGSLLLDRLGASALDAFLAAAAPATVVDDDSAAGLRVAELRQLGGVLARPDPAGGALSHVDGRFLLVATPHTPSHAAGGDDEPLRVLAAMAPFATGARYLGLAAEQGDVRAGFDATAWSRLRAIRAAVDPGELFIATHPIPPAR
jgi:hypothetical protein